MYGFIVFWAMRNYVSAIIPLRSIAPLIISEGNWIFANYKSWSLFYLGR